MSELTQHDLTKVAEEEEEYFPEDGLWNPMFEPLFDDEVESEKALAKKEIHEYFPLKLSRFPDKSLDLLHDLFKCVSCNDFPESEEFALCCGGHRTCGDCVDIDTPRCSKKLEGEGKDVLICGERLIMSLCSVYTAFFNAHKFPCKNVGCGAELVGPEVADHKKKCIFKPKYNCLDKDCKYRGLFSQHDLLIHLNRDHDRVAVYKALGDSVVIPWKFATNDNALGAGALLEVGKASRVQELFSKTVIGGIFTAGDVSLLLIIEKLGDMYFFRLALLEEDKGKELACQLSIFDAEGNEAIWIDKACLATDDASKLIEYGHCLCVYSERINSSFLVKEGSDLAASLKVSVDIL